MIPLKTEAQLLVRNDEAGQGHFGADRGARTHRGVDFYLLPGAVLLSPVTGTITKVGYPYADDLSYRYVEVTLMSTAKHRFFYVEPEHDVGTVVQVGTRLGTAQDIVKRYPDIGMKNHVHYEIKTNEGTYVNPEEYWA